MSATTTRVPAKKKLRAPQLPDGFHMSTVWLDGRDRRIEGSEAIPINSLTLKPAGVPWMCPQPDCETGEWVIDKGDGQAQPKRPYCPGHGSALVAQPIDAADPNAVASARTRLAQRVTAAVQRSREKVMEAAADRLLRAQQAVLEAGRSTAADYASYAPSLGTAAALVVGGVTAVEAGDPLQVAAAACTFAVAGAVIAYAAAYWYSRERARQRGQRLTQGALDAGARRQARMVAAATGAAGLWTAADAGVRAAGYGQGTILGTLMLGAAVLLCWLIGQGHWARLAAGRELQRRLAREQALLQMQAAQREAKAAEQTVAPPTESVFDEEDPLQVGAWMARRWEEISRHPDVPNRFSVMPRTKILSELTRAVLAPQAGGGQRRIGWEFVIQGEPGVLVPPPALPSPVIHARIWLAAMLGRDPMSLAMVERPDGDINRAVLLITDGAPLGEPVPYLGRHGIQVLSSGTILGHDGRDIKGHDTFMPLYIPGQTFGGLVLGKSGGGKSQSRRVRILNNLYAGIYTTLYDPKNFVDYSEFAGIIPMGCTKEHRDVILRSLWAEMIRRQQMLSQLVGRDRHGRMRPVEGAWRIDRDGPPILSMWDEFHLESRDPDYVARLTTLSRLQRATASGVEVATQGGGLADLGDSVLRMLLNQTGLEVYKMAKQQAALGGYTGSFDPNSLPSVAGMVLKVYGEGGEPIPQRSAFVTRDDVDGSVYDHLYAPDGSQILFAPDLPAETVAVFEREGLMDLLRLGQGPGGLARLQAADGDSTVPAPGMVAGPAPAGPAGKPIDGRIMVLAILASGPIRTFGEIAAHPMWLQDPNRSRLPKATTIHRPLKDLEREGLVINPGRTGVWRELTARGQSVAAKALLTVEVAIGKDRPAAGGGTADPNSQAEMERELLEESEDRRMIREQVAAATAADS